MNTDYITPEGYKKLSQELEHLWRVERPEWTQRVSDAAAEGDRSENAEYIYSKKKLREIDRRIRYLQKRLDVLRIVDRLPNDQSRIYFGAWVKIEDEAGNSAWYRLVGRDEADASCGYISIHSPLARALLGKGIGSEVTFVAAGQTKWVEVLDIRYTGSNPPESSIAIDDNA